MRYQDMDLILHWRQKKTPLITEAHYQNTLYFLLPSGLSKQPVKDKEKKGFHETSTTGSKFDNLKVVKLKALD